MKDKLDCVLSVRVCDEVYKRIQELSEINGWSLSHVSNKLICLGLQILDLDEVDPE